MEQNYFKEREIKNICKLKKMLKDLPPFCGEFFRGIEPKTTILTRVNYAYDLKVFFYFLTNEIEEFKGTPNKYFKLVMLESVTATHLEMYLSYLTYFKFNDNICQNSESAKGRKLATVRSMFKYFYNKEKLSQNIASKVSLPKIHEKEIIRLEANEVKDLLNNVETGNGLNSRQLAFHNKTKLRDIALLTLLLGTGIRISECVGLNLEDIDFKTNSFTITRKGGNKVILYFSDEVGISLLEYYEERTQNKEIDEDEKALFLSIQNKRISIKAIENLVKKYAKITTPLKKISPHKLRSTYGTALYRETKDIYIVAEVLGHKDVNTTKKHYAAISEDIRKNAANKVTLRENK